MSRIFLISLLFFLPPTGEAGVYTPSSEAGVHPPTGKEIVQKMYYRFGGKWYRTFSFNQTTDIYRNDSLRLSQTWYEFIRFPDRFRMDFGSSRQRQCRHLPR